jgi:hypothetical protein
VLGTAHGGRLGTVQAEHLFTAGPIFVAEGADDVELGAQDPTS